MQPHSQRLHLRGCTVSSTRTPLSGDRIHSREQTLQFCPTVYLEWLAATWCKDMYSCYVCLWRGWVVVDGVGVMAEILKDKVSRYYSRLCTVLHTAYLSCDQPSHVTGRSGEAVPTTTTIHLKPVFVGEISFFWTYSCQDFIGQTSAEKVSFIRNIVMFYVCVWMRWMCEFKGPHLATKQTWRRVHIAHCRVMYLAYITF